MKKDKIVAIIAGIALVIAIFGLFRVPSGITAEESTFDDVLKEDKLSLCYVPWPPSITKDPDTGDLSGFIIDIVNEVATEANFQVTYVESTWGGFPADLNVGKCDAAIAAIYPLIGRSTSVAFTRPFFYAGNSVAVKADDTRFADIGDLNRANIKIAVVQGEYGHVYAKRHLPKAKLVVLEKSVDTTMPLVAVATGQADAGFAESNTVKAFVEEQEGVKDLFPNQPYSTTPITWSVRKGDQELLNFLDNAITYLKATGFLDSTTQKYEPEGWYTQKQEYVDLS
tara:strand:- start:2790 stop:3638 length:849 start_codon:yes stop_codon:yes gene_type:complete